MLLLIIGISIFVFGVILGIKVSSRYEIFGIMLGIFLGVVGILTVAVSFNTAPNGYEEPVLTSMYEILPIEKDDSWFTNEREAYVIEVSQTDPTKYFICTKRLSENIPKSFETYNANTSLIYSDECLLKVYDVVAKPSIWAAKKIHYTQYEICVPENAVLKINY